MQNYCISIEIFQHLSKPIIMGSYRKKSIPSDGSSKKTVDVLRKMADRQEKRRQLIFFIILAAEKIDIMQPCKQNDVVKLNRLAL